MARGSLTNPSSTSQLRLARSARKPPCDGVGRNVIPQCPFADTSNRFQMDRWLGRFEPALAADVERPPDAFLGIGGYVSLSLKNDLSQSEKPRYSLVIGG